ncbi:putative uncharacterized protein [Clostridium sp. CAG:609]|nr:putative uncharacterized protein [Clostridium sp. CAG:609]
MMFDEKINYCILHNNPDENFINKLGSIPVIKDLEFNKLVERLEFFPNKQVIFNETLYGLKLDEKTEIFKLLKKQNISYINVTSNVEDALYSDYIFVYDGNKLVLEGNRNEVLKEEKTLKRLGYGLPFVVDLSIQLNYYDIFNKVYYDLDELVGALWN